MDGEQSSSLIKYQIILIFSWMCEKLVFFSAFVSQNIQSTNWQTMRFKPPPPNSDIGWRVEFRPMEVRHMHQQELTQKYSFASCSSPFWCCYEKALIYKIKIKYVHGSKSVQVKEGWFLRIDVGKGLPDPDGELRDGLGMTWSEEGPGSGKSMFV